MKGQSVRIRTVILTALTCGVVVGGVLIWEQRNQQRDEREHMKELAHTVANTHFYLRNVAEELLESESRTNKPIPADSTLFFSYIKEGLGTDTLLSTDNPYFDQDHNEYQDFWKNKIIALSENGGVVGVGSCGPNGRWDGGRDDDIYVPFDRTTPQGTTTRGTAARGIASSQTQPVFVLAWPGYDGDYARNSSPTWMLDSENLGKGKAGYERLLDRMKTFPAGSTLRFEFNPDTKNNAGIFEVPMSLIGFKRLAERQNITLGLPRGIFVGVDVQNDITTTERK
jgi:hypothetical protein